MTRAQGAEAGASASRWSRILRGLAAGLHALVLGSLAWGLPTSFDLVTALGATVVCLGWATLAVASWSVRLDLVKVARGVALISLLAFAALAARVLFWARYLFDIYGSLGGLLGGGLLVVLGAIGLVLLTYPLVLLTEFRLGRRVALCSLAVLSLVLLAGLVWPTGQRITAELPPLDAEQLRGALVAASKRQPKHGSRQRRDLSGTKPYRCEHVPDSLHPTVWLQYRNVRGKLRQECLQATTSEALVQRVASRVSQVASGDVKLDVLRSKVRIDPSRSLLAALSLRPGLDGACAGARCFTPSQLILRDELTSYRPLPQVKDASVGVDVDALRATLDESAPLFRIRADSYLLERSEGTTEIVELRQMRAWKRPLDSAQVVASVGSALRFLERSQLRNGKFRYEFRPYLGRSNAKNWNLPRHAGTTLAYCEWSSDSPEAKRVRSKALRFLDRSRRVSARGEHYYLQRGAAAGLGHTALPTIALLECAERGHRPDPAVLRGLLLYFAALQKPDGSFYPELDVLRGRPSGEGESLYASGQAVYALVLLERYAKQHPEAGLVADRVHRLVTRAMSYYGGPYWRRAPYHFFFVEENWHCLAARAALEVHRDERYEDFCLDYVRFKARFVQETPERESLHGGMTPSPLFPPHNTNTAGILEAGAAALRIAQRRGMRLPELERRVRLALGFLLNAQIEAAHCFACRSPEAADGGFTESATSPLIRIDYVQHALAGIAHAGVALGLKPAS